MTCPKSSTNVAQASPESSTGVSPVSGVVHSRDGYATLDHATPMPFVPFNPHADMEIRARNLPHWNQAGTTYFVTFRLADSLPQAKLQQWKEERDGWIKHHPEPWTHEVWEEYNRLFPEKLDLWLDAGAGSCHLANPKCAQIVADALRHFDGERYCIGDFVIMPNHVHALVCLARGFSFTQILYSWKSFAAHQINKLLGRSGAFWQAESYDRIVRSEKQRDHYRHYIAENPVKARLKPQQFYLNVAQASPESSTGVSPVSDAVHSRDGYATMDSEHSRDGRATMPGSPTTFLIL